MSTTHNRRTLWAAVWLLVLCAYALAGINEVSFHGDEAMQMHMSRDYATAFIDRLPERLLTAPPYPIDSDGHLRILNGTINRYAIGAALYAAGYTAADLPPPPGWDWGLSYADGVATGHRPTPALLFVGRVASALFLCVSIAALYALTQVVARSPFAAWFAAALYALNDAMLLNGRRAVQEGSLLAFGLLTLLIAAHISRRERSGVGAWLLLGIAGALTLASKHSGAVFVAAAFGWALVGRGLLRRKLVGLTLAGAVTVAGFVALSPALWSDPFARFGDLLQVRAELLDIQVAIDPLAPTPLAQRINDFVTLPFLAALQQYELASWGTDPAFTAETTLYRASPLSGVQPGVVGGVLLTVCALGGLLAAVRRWHDPALRGLLVWAALVWAAHMVNPLSWQRYGLALVPLAALLAGLGVALFADQYRAHLVRRA